MSRFLKCLFNWCGGYVVSGWRTTDSGKVLCIGWRCATCGKVKHYEPTRNQP